MGADGFGGARRAAGGALSHSGGCDVSPVSIRAGRTALTARRAGRKAGECMQYACYQYDCYLRAASITAHIEVIWKSVLVG